MTEYRLVTIDGDSGWNTVQIDSLGGGEWLTIIPIKSHLTGCGSSNDIVGQIGDAPVFAVGDGYDTSSSSAGMLRLAVNGACSGTATVLVVVGAPGQPPNQGPAELPFNFASADSEETSGRISLHNGEKRLSETDLILSTPAGPLTFTRSYRQGALDDYQFMGRGWTHNHSITLTFSSGATPDAMISLPHGGICYYLAYWVDAWDYSPGPGAVGELAPTNDPPNGWILTYPDLSSWVFEPTAISDTFRLKERHWPGSEVWNYSYDGSDKLTRVDDGHERYLDFDYWSGDPHAGQLKSVTDHTGRSIQLNYVSSGEGSLLSEAVDVFGQSWQYEYDAGETDPALQDFLIERTSPPVDITGDNVADSLLTLERLTYQTRDESNILSNGDMELDSGWYPFGATPYPYYLNERSSGPYGYCRHVRSTNYSGIQSEPLALIAGAEYTISAQIYIETGQVTMRLSGSIDREVGLGTLGSWQELNMDAFIQETDDVESLLFLARNGNAEFYVDNVSVMEKRPIMATTQEIGIVGEANPLLKTDLVIRADDKNVTTETIANRTTKHYFARGIYAGTRDAANNVALHVGDSDMAGCPYRPSALIDCNANLQQIFWTRFDSGFSQDGIIKSIDALGKAAQFVYDPDNRLSLSVDAKGRPKYYRYTNASQPRWPTIILTGSSNLVHDGLMEMAIDDPENPWIPIAGNDPDDVYQGEMVGGNCLIVSASAIGQGVESNEFEVVAGKHYLVIALVQANLGSAKVAITGVPSADMVVTESETWQTVNIPYTSTESGLVKLQFTAAALSSGYAEFNFTDVAVMEIAQWEELTYNDSGLVLSHAIVDPADGTSILRKVTNTYHTALPGTGLLATTSIHDRTDENVTLTRSFEYNDYGLVAKITDEIGAVKLIGYDVGGRVVRVIESASNPTYDFIAYPDLNTYAISASPDKDIVTDHVYDALGRLIETKTGVGAFINGVSQLRRDLTVYDAMGRVKRTIDNYVPGVSSPYTAVRTSFDHGTNNDQNLISDIAYNARGLVSKKVDQAGVVTLFGYDDGDRLVKTVYNAGSASYNASYFGGDPDLSAYVGGLNSDQDIITTFEYDNAGNLVKTVDPLGNVSFTVYDALNRPVKTVQSTKPEATIALDAGDTGYSTANDPRSAGYVPSSLVDKDIISTRTYDAVGNVVKTVDPIGNMAFMVYDDLDRLVKTVRNAKDTASIATDPDAPDYIAGDDPRSDWYAPSTEPDRDIITRTEYENALHVKYSEDPMGVRTWLAYDGFNRAIKAILNPSVSDPRFQSYTPSSDADKDIITETIYNTLGQVQEVIDPLNRKMHYQYDAIGRVVSTTTNYVDGIFSDSAPDEDVISSVSYTKQGWVRQEKNPLGNSTFHAYDGVGRRNATTVNYSTGKPGARPDLDRITTVSYGLDSQPISVFDPAGVETRFEYDTARRRIRAIANHKDGIFDPGNTDTDIITQTAYNKAGLVTGVTDPRGGVARMDYDSALRPRAVTRPNGAVDWTRYDKAGQVIRVIQNVSYRPGDDVMPDDPAYSPLGHGEMEDRDLVSVIVRDRAGRVTHAVDPLNLATQMTYNKAGSLLSSVDPAGVKTCYIYDGVHRLVKVAKGYMDPGGIDAEPANWVWNGEWQDGNGHAVQHGVHNDRNIITIITLDKAGRQTKITDPNGNDTHYVYDDLDRQTSVTDPASLTWQTDYVPMRDAGTLRVVTTDPGGHEVKRDMDRLGRPTRVFYGDTATPNVNFVYSLHGDMIQMIESVGASPSRITNCLYDRLHRLKSAYIDVDGNGSSDHGIAYQYDQGGLRTQMAQIPSSLGPTINYVYDSSGRLERIHGGSWNTSFYYDGVDRMTSMFRDNGLKSEYRYDAASRLKSLEHMVGNLSFGSFEYQRDSVGNPFQVDEFVPVANGGETTIGANLAIPVGGSWSLVNGFQVSTQAGSKLFLGPIYSASATLTLGTGPDQCQCEIIVADSKGERVVKKVSTNAPIAGEREVTINLRREGWKSLFIRSRQYLSLTKVRYKNVSFPNSSDNQTVTYQYDTMNRPYHAEISGRSKVFYDFTYDRVGHLTEHTTLYQGDAGGTTSVMDYGTSGYRLETRDGHPVSYDANGNMAYDGSMTYTWDRANRLIQVQGGGQDIQHTYNGLNQRVKLTQNSVPTSFLYDGTSQWAIGATDSAGTTRFMIGPMGIHAQQTNSNAWICPLMDGLGNIRGVVENASQSESRQYSPIGQFEQRLASGSRHTPFGLGGGQDDPSGLNYLFTSYYHPGIGRTLNPLQQFWANYKILADFAQNPNNSWGDRIGVSLLAGAYGGFALIPVALAIAMNPAAAVGVGLISAGVGGIEYQLAKSGAGGPERQQWAQNTDYAQYMIENAYFGAISGPLGAAFPRATAVVGLGASAGSMIGTANYAAVHGGWTDYDRFYFGLATFGFAASAAWLGSAAIQQRYFVGSLADEESGSWMYGYINRSSGSFKFFGRTAAGRYGIASGSLLIADESVIYGDAPAIRGLLGAGPSMRAADSRATRNTVNFIRNLQWISSTEYANSTYDFDIVARQGPARKVFLPSQGDVNEPYIYFNASHKDAFNGTFGGILYESHHPLQKAVLKKIMKEMPLIAVLQANRTRYSINLQPTVTLQRGTVQGIRLAHSVINNFQLARAYDRLSSGLHRNASTLDLEFWFLLYEFRVGGFTDPTIQKVLDWQYNYFKRLGLQPGMHFDYLPDEIWG